MDSEALRVAIGPLKVVEQAPQEVPLGWIAFVDGALQQHPSEFDLLRCRLWQNNKTNADEILTEVSKFDSRSGKAGETPHLH